MIQLIVNQPQNSGLGDTAYIFTTKINENFTELYDKISVIEQELIDSNIDTLVDDLSALNTSISNLQDDVNTINNTLIAVNQTLIQQSAVIAELQNIINNL